MRSSARRGYLLVYILAGMPLMVALSAVSFNLISRALRGQRIAVVQTNNDQEAPRLVREFRRDARRARRVDVRGDLVRLSLDEETITYTLGAGETRYRADADGSVREQASYGLGHVTVSARHEVLEGGVAFVWLIFDFHSRWQPKDIDASRLAAAARVGSEVLR